MYTIPWKKKKSIQDVYHKHYIKSAFTSILAITIVDSIFFLNRFLYLSKQQNNQVWSQSGSDWLKILDFFR